MILMSLSTWASESVAQLSASAETSRFSNGSIQQSEPVEGVLGKLPFGKSLDVHKLMAVLKLSNTDLIRHLQKEGIVIQRFEGNSSYICGAADCLGQEILELPKVDDAVALQVLSENNQNQSVLGFYIEPSKSSHGSAAGYIGIHIAADRWSLIHEYVHHLMKYHEGAGDREKKKYLGVRERNFHQMVENAKLRKILGENSPVSDQARNEILEVIGNVSESVISALQASALEEIAVEYALLRLYKQNLLVHNNARVKESFEYIILSSLKAQIVVSQTIEKLENLKLRANGWVADSEIAFALNRSFMSLGLLNRRIGEVQVSAMKEFLGLKAPSN